MGTYKREIAFSIGATPGAKELMARLGEREQVGWLSA